MNHRPTYICTIAQRVEDKGIFATFPQQSDYVELWNRAQQPRHEINWNYYQRFSDQDVVLGRGPSGTFCYDPRAAAD